MSHSLHHSPGGPAAQTLPPVPPTQDESLPAELLEHVRRLRLILPLISISVMALHRQDAELDADMASVLSEHACVPLDDEIERIEPLSHLSPGSTGSRRRTHEPAEPTPCAERIDES